MSIENDKLKEFHVIKQLLYMTYKPQGPWLINANELYLAYTDITSLPDDLYVPDGLFLQHCKKLTSLPKGLYVGGDLIVWGCPKLTRLPDGLYVSGYLDLDGCENLISIPEDLHVGKNLDLGGCTSLPEKLPKLKNVKGKIFR